MPYLHAGITFGITVQFFKGDPNDLVAYVNKEFGPDLYEMRKEDKVFRFTLKDEYLEPQDFANFLQYQYSVGGDLVDESPSETAKFISQIRQCKNKDEIVSCVESLRSYSIQKYDGEFFEDDINYVTVRLFIESLTFFRQGKIAMECYNSFMAYLTALLKRDSSAFKCAKAARIFIG